MSININNVLVVDSKITLHHITILPMYDIVVIKKYMISTIVVNSMADFPLTDYPLFCTKHAISYIEL
jgi:hypothetical protein